MGTLEIGIPKTMLISTTYKAIRFRPRHHQSFRPGSLSSAFLAKEVPDSRQRQILQETGVTWLRVADQVKERQHQAKKGSTKRGLRVVRADRRQ
jgi:hypothetical protein